MGDRYKFNPFSNKLDDVGPIVMIGGSLYYFYGGNRYLITATLNNPSSSYFLQEDGSSFILLEDGSSKLVLEA